MIHISFKSTHQLMVLFDQALVSGVNFVMAILLARLLGIESFGLYAFGWMLVLFVSSIQLAFIVSPLFTLFPKHQKRMNYLSGVHTIQLCFAIVTFIISFAVVKGVFIYKPEWEIAGVLHSLPLVATLFVLQDFYRRVNFTLKKPLRSLISDGISYGGQPIAILLLHHFDTLSIHHSFLAISALFSASIFYNLPKVKLTFKSLIIKNTITENWSFSKYLVGTALLQWVSGNFFIIVAGGLLGPVAIGAIRIAQNVVGVLHVLFSAMENIIPIKAAEILDQEGTVKTIYYLKKMLFKGGLVTLIILAIIALFRIQIITLFYGIEYLDYVNVLLGFTGLYILVFIGTILGFVIRTFEMNHIFFWSYIITTVFSLFAAEAIITQTGIYGVLIGLFITQFINISFYVIKLNSKLKKLWK
ncbi:MAG: oligosaccharide flippase family protein [Flavobacteriales bacterium]|nr:oligosaccharide flippase family protein [Flavobacteriales bacterium]NQX96784.1 oligosaccharide flippase family protein [Flavobacteriales bacterium]